MQVYMYCAAFYCQACGEKLCATEAKPAGMDPTNESTWDSDEYPKGPYPNGGGEADTPQHCDSCGVFLQNPLTTDGYDYVREAVSLIPALEMPDASWNEIATKAEKIGKPHLGQWIRYYFDSEYPATRVKPGEAA